MHFQRTDTGFQIDHVDTRDHGLPDQGNHQHLIFLEPRYRCHHVTKVLMTCRSRWWLRYRAETALTERRAGSTRFDCGNAGVQGRPPAHSDCQSYRAPDLAPSLIFAVEIDPTARSQTRVHSEIEVPISTSELTKSITLPEPSEEITPLVAKLKLSDQPEAVQDHRGGSLTSSIIDQKIHFAMNVQRHAVVVINMKAEP